MTCASLPAFLGVPQGQGECLIHLCTPSTEHSAWHKEGTRCLPEMSHYSRLQKKEKECFFLLGP